MTDAGKDVASYLARRARWSPFEIAFWVLAFATIWLFPGKYLILTETAILGLFALSLDLILGYAGIISLGHAAFFGLAGYTAGLIAKYGLIDEPVVALVLSCVAPEARRACSASQSHLSWAGFASICTAPPASSIR